MESPYERFNQNKGTEASGSEYDRFKKSETTPPPKPKPQRTPIEPEKVNILKETLKNFFGVGKDRPSTLLDTVKTAGRAIGQGLDKTSADFADVVVRRPSNLLFGEGWNEEDRLRKESEIELAKRDEERLRKAQESGTEGVYKAGKFVGEQIPYFAVPETPIGATMAGIKGLAVRSLARGVENAATGALVEAGTQQTPDQIAKTAGVNLLAGVGGNAILEPLIGLAGRALGKKITPKEGLDIITPEEPVGPIEKPIQTNDVIMPETTKVEDYKWYRGEGQNIYGNKGDKFFSADEYTVGDYGKVREITPEEQPKKPLVASDKIELAQKIGYKGDPFNEPLNTKNNYDDMAKKYAIKNGYDSIIYKSGSMDEPELHVFTETISKPMPVKKVVKPRVSTEKISAVIPTKPKVKLNESEYYAKIPAKTKSGNNPIDFKGIRPENLVHFNQGDNYGRVSVIVTAKDKSLIEAGKAFNYKNPSANATTKNKVKALAFELGKTEEEVRNIAVETNEKYKALARANRDRDKDVLLNFATKEADRTKKAVEAKPKAKKKIPTTISDEARKYKSAEEFVKAQGTPIYRGQSKPGSSLQQNIGDAMPELGGGKFFTTDKKLVDIFGGNTIEKVSNAKNTVTKQETIKLQEMATKQVEKDISMQIESNPVIGDMALGRPKAFAEYTGKPIVEVQHLLGRQGGEVVYYEQFDKSTFKTKSQLTDIWNKAKKYGKVSGGSRTSKYYSRLKTELQDILETDGTYNPMNLEEDARRASGMVENDYDRAVKIALGYEEAAEDITDTAISRAVIMDALEKNNPELAADATNKLVTKATRKGQEVAAFKGTVGDTNPTNYMRQAVAQKTEQVAKKYGGQKKLEETVKRETKQLSDKIKKKDILKITQAQDLLERLTCK